VVMSDNGATTSEPYENPYGRRWLEKHYHRQVETLGEKGSWVAAGRRWGQVSNTPLSGHKFYAGEGGVRVPLIITGLPDIDSGDVLGAFVHVTDLAPTLLAIAGVETPAASDQSVAMSGKSVLPLLQGSAAPLHHPDEAIGYEFSGNSALYRGGYKLVRDQPPIGDRQWRLYDINTDPGEAADLSNSMPGLFHELQQEYMHYVEEVGVLPMPDNYSLVRQVTVNAVLFFYLPRYLPHIIGILLLLVIAILVLRHRNKAL